MKIMLVTDAPWLKTGYGIQGKILARYLERENHEVFIYAPGGFYGAKQIIDIAEFPDFSHAFVTVLGADFGDDRAGSSGYPYWINDIVPDLVITMLDANSLHTYAVDGTPTWMWAPIDTWPVSDGEQGILSRADKVICPSMWGLRQLADAHIDGIYIPYGLDYNHYNYETYNEKLNDVRNKTRTDMFHIDDDTFLIGMVGMHYPHPDRKGFAYAMEAIGLLVKNHPRANIKAYFQTDVVQGDGFLDLRDLRHSFGLDNIIGFAQPSGPVQKTNEFMDSLYLAFDVLLQPSICEGFGLPVIEAQSVGTPVIVNSATALNELMGPGSLGAIPAGSQIMVDGTMASIPSVPMIHKALEEMYAKRNRQDLEFLSLRAQRMKWVRNIFNWDRLWSNGWKPILEKFEKEQAADTIRMLNGPRLVLGCGTRPETAPNVVNHDRTIHHDYVNVAHDLNEFDWPFDDNFFMSIDMGDVIEHLSAPIDSIMNELWRIIVKSPDARLDIRTCIAGSWQHQTDPTHTRGFTLHSFDYFDPDTDLGRDYGASYAVRPWRILKRGVSQSGDLMVTLSPRSVAEE